MSYYLKYMINNLEPLRISDDSISEQGQTACLNYIPGSTIRGSVITRLSERDDFGSLKEKLFSDETAFLNAYLSVDGEALLPSPKGFYEDKRIIEGEKEIQNVVINGDFDEGYKRAGLGNVSKLDFNSGVMTYYNAKQNSELKIKIGDNMYRNDYLEKGQKFRGAIRCEDKSLLQTIEEILGEGSIIIGNARSSGYGKCDIKIETIDEADNYSQFATKSELKDYAYLYLLSDTVMRDDNGEYCGINTNELQKKLGVENLEIEYCSTSIRDVRGYNRTLGVRLPSVTMYEKGSVFKIKFDKEITNEKAGKLIDSGIGVRRNEGYGRFLLLDSSYENLCKKAAGKSHEKTIEGDKKPEDRDVLLQIAKNYYRKRIDIATRKYVVDNVRDRGGISSSKARVIEPIIVSNRFDINKAKRILDDYYKHEDEKQSNRRRQRVDGNIGSSRDHVREVLDKELVELLDIKTKENNKVMGFPVSDLLTEEEEGRVKLEIILSELRYDNKGGKKNE